MIITSDSYKTTNLKYDKVSPRVARFDYRKHKYAIYIYLDPFHSGEYEYKFKCYGKPQTVKSAYLPVYVGKLENSLQYRMNHHINNFARNIEDSQNQFKKKFFQELERQIEQNKQSGNPDNLMPKSLDEYKNNWIIIIKTFDNPKDLREYERELIKAIGTQYDGSGPLVNKKKGN